MTGSLKIIRRILTFTNTTTKKPSEMQGTEHNTAKHLKCHFRKQKSMKNTQNNLGIQFGLRNFFSLTRLVYVHEKEAPTYNVKVKIARDPSCTCLLSLKISTVCKHGFWVMILFKIPENSYLLHQKASYTATYTGWHSGIDEAHEMLINILHSNIHSNILHSNILHSNTVA